MRKFSKTTLAFYDVTLGGTIPDDAVEVPDALAAEIFAAQNAGMRILAGADGLPQVSAVGNAEKLAAELSQLSAAYQADMAALTQAYIAATIADGPNEATRKNAVALQYSNRITQYKSDVAAVRAKYTNP